ncbi:MAG: UDP-N-acetylmuramoyl-L-alanyl-D-glutamate--2,6-diaminopimelate ligase [Candidatus Omnitrophica bacterium]|nr:UDP-N-acetylmuramoyl-L-alanyl-D-glutamate--2,6-diaminopimelate ligase [Candidatus Omnitrophota bacterium]
MKLGFLIKSLPDCRVLSESDDFEVTSITCDSRKASCGTLFVAVKGLRDDGHEFIQEAIKKGAQAIVVEKMRFPHADIQSGPNKIAVISVRDTRLALADLAAEFYGRPSQKVKVAGITGTNGKTTTTYLIESILKEGGYSPAVLGTVNYRFKEKIFPSSNTTPGPLELQSLLAQIVKEKIDYAIIEVSSHALDQNRTQGIDFHSAIFTNLSQDHLDYHRTLEDYFQAKAALFRNLKPGAFAVINEDDACSKKLKAETAARVVTYAIEKQADIFARDIDFGLSRSEFLLVTRDEKDIVNTGLIGRHNLYNVLAAVAWAKEAGITFDKIKSGIEKFYSVPGRLEKIETQRGFSVFVDYAHTEDALKNVISALRQISLKKIIVVFGCGGERDKTKRPKMGRVVSDLADFAVITSDNPRSEEPGKIIEEIKTGINKDNYCVIADRREAIEKALSLAGPEDIVLVAGKGHETYQVLKDGVIDFDDREVIKSCLKSMS